MLKSLAIRTARFFIPGFCPICDSATSFADFGARGKVLCPRCQSLERQRAIFLWLHRFADWDEPKKTKLLHIAPEGSLVQVFSNRKNLDYLTADLQSPHAMMKLDLTKMPFEPESFDVIVCSHVLEHIVDDRSAIREMYRVLRPEGIAVVSVPLRGSKTFEDFSITCEAGRLAAFGQHDHVRLCGRDYRERFIEAGFETDLIVPSKAFGYYQTIRTRTETESFFVGYK